MVAWTSTPVSSASLSRVHPLALGSDHGPHAASSALLSLPQIFLTAECSCHGSDYRSTIVLCVCLTHCLWSSCFLLSLLLRPGSWPRDSPRRGRGGSDEKAWEDWTLLIRTAPRFSFQVQRCWCWGAPCSQGTLKNKAGGDTGALVHCGGGGIK